MTPQTMLEELRLLVPAANAGLARLRDGDRQEKAVLYGLAARSAAPLAGLWHVDLWRLLQVVEDLNRCGAK